MSKTLAQQAREDWYLRHKEYQKNQLTRLGFKVENLTENQIETIMIPFDAPENYYHDGEISHAQAKAIWKNQLIQSGINGSDLIRALNLIK
jgi:hypothetical protein